MIELSPIGLVTCTSRDRRCHLDTRRDHPRDIPRRWWRRSDRGNVCTLIKSVRPPLAAGRLNARKFRLSRRGSRGKSRETKVLRSGPDSRVAPHPMTTHTDRGVGPHVAGRQAWRTHRLKRRLSSNLISAMSFCMLRLLKSACISTFLAFLD